MQTSSCESILGQVVLQGEKKQDDNVNQNEELQVLLIEDNPGDARLIKELLLEASVNSFRVYQVENLADGLAHLAEQQVDVTLIDLGLPDSRGLDTLKRISSKFPSVPHIVLTGLDDDTLGQKAIKMGAQDFLQKGKINGFMLSRVVRYAVERKQAHVELLNSHNLLTAILKGMPDEVFVKDHQGRYVVSNPARNRSLQLKDSGGLGKDDTAFYPPEVARRLMEADREVIETGEMIRREEQVANASGETRTFLTSKYPWRDENGQVIGVIGIGHDITERVRANQKIQRLLQEQVAINQLSISLGEAGHLDDIYHLIYEHVKGLMDAYTFIISLYDAETDLIHAGCVICEDQVMDIQNIPPLPLAEPGKGIQSQVIRSGKPYYSSDYLKSLENSKTKYVVEKDGSLTNAADSEDKGDTRSAIFAPMKDKGQVIGVMQVQSNCGDAYSPDDLGLLSAISNVAAIAIQNTRLMNETRRRLEQLKALRSIDQAITGSMDIHVTLDVFLRQVVQQLEVDAAAVLLYQPDLRQLDFAAGRGFRSQALRFTSLRMGQGFAGRAALERRIVQVSDLSQLNTGFLRSPEFIEEGFASYIGVPLIAKGNINGVLEIFQRKSSKHSSEWMDFLETLAGQAAIAVDNYNLFTDLQSASLGLTQAYDATIEGWAHALEMRDMETEGHSRRVVGLTVKIARKMDLRDDEIAHLRRGALLHDIGKMAVPDAILQKTGKLTDEEWKIMTQHPVYAFEWLSPIEYLRPALDIPFYHHERWDGTGYPRGLKGVEIPLAARIFAIADVYDALKSDRPYRKAWAEERAIEYILEQSGKHFDPQVVEIFFQLKNDQS